MAVSETPRPNVLNHYQMLLPSYAATSTAEDRKTELTGNEAKT